MRSRCLRAGRKDRPDRRAPSTAMSRPRGSNRSRPSSAMSPRCQPTGSSWCPSWPAITTHPSARSSRWPCRLAAPCRRDRRRGRRPPPRAHRRRPRGARQDTPREPRIAAIAPARAHGPTRRSLLRAEAAFIVADRRCTGARLARPTSLDDRRRTAAAPTLTDEQQAALSQIRDAGPVSAPGCCTASPAAARPRSTQTRRRRPRCQPAGAHAGTEIALTPQLEQQVQARFPDARIVSPALRPGRRRRPLTRLRAGAVRPRRHRAYTRRGIHRSPAGRDRHRRGNTMPRPALEGVRPTSARQRAIPVVPQCSSLESWHAERTASS